MTLAVLITVVLFLACYVFAQKRRFASYCSQFDAAKMLDLWAQAQSAIGGHLITLRKGGSCAVPSQMYSLMRPDTLVTPRAKMTVEIVLAAKPDHDFVFHKNFERQIGKGLFVGVFRTSSQKRAIGQDSREYFNHLKHTESGVKNLSETYGVVKSEQEPERTVEWFMYSGETYFELMLRTYIDESDTWIMNVQIGEWLTRSEENACTELIQAMFIMMATLTPETVEAV
jgi:hypothetical protein